MEVLLKMGKYTGISSVLAIPDNANYVHVSKLPPIEKQIIIGTPGTIRRWITAKKLSMSFMKILVFDEGDHLLTEDLPVRFNHPLEPDYEVYQHRVGRAGCFGHKGAVFNLLYDRDKNLMEKIEKHFNHQVAEVGSWESDDDFRDALSKSGLIS